MDICSLALDYKSRTKRNLSEAEFYDKDLGELKAIVQALGENLPTRSTKSGLAKIISKLVAEKCPDGCLA